ncbi:MAG: glycosyltransferase [Spirulinaceae cyanobacterium SM2_1_0]|nr:glycosyltransferase [Spirulinaceae cyanobacterium SM2_1_0]
MQLVQINQSDLSGGAAIAAYRLHQGLLAAQVDSQLLVGKVVSTGSRVTAVPRRYWLDNQLSRLSRRFSLNYVSIVSSFDLPHHPLVQTADLLHFHNLHTGYFNYLALPALTRQKPAVLTLHDMWSFTGHCAYSYDCERWRTGCGQCPYPQEYPEIHRDSTRLEWWLKRQVYARSRLTIVTPSRWLQGVATQSLLRQYAIHHIAYGIDTEVYRPRDRQQCRSLLDIAPDRHVLMFAAERLDNFRKGADLLREILLGLPAAYKAKSTLLILGTGGEALAETVGIASHNLGYVDSDYLKVVAYAAADLVLFPTRADNLPLVLQESLACGTPMVSFDVGGVSELVRPGVTGYLARPHQTSDFRQGLIQLLDSPDERERLGRNCRAIAVAEYDLHRQTQCYLDLYQTLLAA